jgi:hypothetical protein
VQQQPVFVAETAAPLSEFAVVAAACKKEREKKREAHWEKA